MKRSLSSELRRLTDAVLEVPDLAGLLRLLSQRLPALLGVSEVACLVWNRRLDAFEGLTAGKTMLQPLETQPEGSVPEARYLLADGSLLDTGSDKGEGTLVPLMARSGLIGMLVLGKRRRRRGLPFAQRQVQLVSRFAARAAVAVENHVYQRELIESERSAALGTMASMLAHDFRGPMTVIRGYAETFLEPGITAEEVRARAEVIVQMVDRLDRMATETLDFARGGGQIARRAVDLREVLVAIAGTVERELSGLQLVRDLQVPAGTSAALDVDKLQRAIANIAANARDAMGGAGRLTIAALVEATVEPPTDPPPPRLVLTLTDQGPGIAPEIRDRLFEPFVSFGKKRGTGLGLAVARHFVESHGGTLTLDEASPDRTGARFRILLPLGNVSNPAPNAM